MDQEIGRALSVWSNVTSLTFQQRSAGPVHIDIRWEARLDIYSRY